MPGLTLIDNTNPYETPASDLSTPTKGALTRSELVPLWIKVFGWVFIAMSISTLPFMLWGAVTGGNVRLELFGLSYIGPALNPYALAMTALYMFMGTTAYGLLFRKDWGVKGCMANGYVGIAICLITSVMSGGANIRLEPIIQFFYLLRLHIIRPDWDTASP